MGSEFALRTKITLRVNTHKSLLRTDCHNPFTVAWEVKTSNRSCVRRDHPCCHRATWICKCGHARDAIMYAMWRRNLFASSGSTGVESCPFPVLRLLHKPIQNDDNDNNDDGDDDDETNDKLLLRRLGLKYSVVTTYTKAAYSHLWQICSLLTRLSTWC